MLDWVWFLPGGFCPLWSWWGQWLPAATCLLPFPLALSPWQACPCPHVAGPAAGRYPPSPTSAEQGWLGEGTWHLLSSSLTGEKMANTKERKNPKVLNPSKMLLSCSICGNRGGSRGKAPPWVCFRQQLAALHRGGDGALHVGGEKPCEDSGFFSAHKKVVAQLGTTSKSWWC